MIEEAQSVLGASGGSREDSPFVAWVKEGRKYGLGAVLITQQPGSIPAELVSQGDNFFVFHLLPTGISCTETCQCALFRRFWLRC